MLSPAPPPVAGLLPRGAGGKVEQLSNKYHAAASHQSQAFLPLSALLDSHPPPLPHCRRQKTQLSAQSTTHCLVGAFRPEWLTQHSSIEQVGESGPLTAGCRQVALSGLTVIAWRLAISAAKAV